MKTMIEIIGDMLNQKKALVVATILSKKGSAPRGAGTKMLIGEDASIVGTIGGGLLEAMTIQLASDIFKNKTSLTKKFKLSHKDASLEGMVCGGSVEILFEYIGVDMPEQAEIYQQAKALREEGKDFVMITKIPKDNTPIGAEDKFLFTPTQFYGTQNEALISLVTSLRENFNQIGFQLLKQSQHYVVEPFYGLEHLCIVGAGHIAQKVALFAKALGFQTSVLDDRADFSNKERFPNADEIRVVPSYTELSLNQIIHNNSYIVIVTRGHSLDKEVLAQALKTDAKYIGMIGSKGKKNHVYSLLLEEGFTQGDLDRVSCPIGVPINAQTPEEIAISILAELIQVKRS